MNDPIIEEIRDIRLKLLEECGGDLQEYVRRQQVAANVNPDLAITPDEFRARFGKQTTPRRLPKKSDTTGQDGASS